MSDTRKSVSRIDELWRSVDESEWQHALDRYWLYVKPTHLALEREMETITPDDVRRLNADEWYEWLLTKYFRWKYTAPNRLATTTTQLMRQAGDAHGLQQLITIRDRLLRCENARIPDALSTAMKINGLGPAGASGLLAVLFPTKFSTVDQFVVRALREVRSLPESERLHRMKPDNLNPDDGVILIEIMRQKAEQLNNIFGTREWTPRRIDMILWAISHEQHEDCCS